MSAVDAPIYWWEMALFVAIGAGGGVLGGLWDRAWNALAPLRATRPAARVAEALAVSALTSAVVFRSLQRFCYICIYV